MNFQLCEQDILEVSGTPDYSTGQLTAYGAMRDLISESAR